MLYETNVYQMNVEGHLFWVADSKILKGCTGQGESSEEAIRELEENEREWLETAKEYGIEIPPQTAKKEKSYSGKISLRISPYVHEQAAKAAEELEISLNQFIGNAIIEYTGKITSSLYECPECDAKADVSSRIIRFPGTDISPYVNVKEELEEL